MRVGDGCKASSHGPWASKFPGAQLFMKKKIVRTKLTPKQLGSAMDVLQSATSDVRTHCELLPKLATPCQNAAPVPAVAEGSVNAKEKDVSRARDEESTGIG